MSGALTRRGVIQARATVVAVAALPVGIGKAAPVTFDPGAFVDDLLEAGCNLSVHHPVGRDAGPAYV